MELKRDGLAVAKGRAEFGTEVGEGTARKLEDAADDDEDVENEAPEGVGVEILAYPGEGQGVEGAAVGLGEVSIPGEDRKERAEGGSNEENERDE